MTRDSVYYVYAENGSVGRTWDGHGRADALELAISDDKFDQLDGEPFVFRSPRTVSFAKYTAGVEWTDPEETFECPVEETPPPGSVARPPSAAQGPRQTGSQP
jgi:hypothetical protein